MRLLILFKIVDVLFVEHALNEFFLVHGDAFPNVDRLLAAITSIIKAPFLKM